MRMRWSRNQLGQSKMGLNYLKFPLNSPPFVMNKQISCPLCFFCSNWNKARETNNNQWKSIKIDSQTSCSSIFVDIQYYWVILLWIVLIGIDFINWFSLIGHAKIFKEVATQTNSFESNLLLGVRGKLILNNGLNSIVLCGTIVIVIISVLVFILFTFILYVYSSGHSLESVSIEDSIF